MFGHVRNVMALHQVMRGAKLPRPELDKLVHQRLKAVLVSAYLHVPYYRELMQSVGYDPVRDYQGPQDLSLLPITTKEVLKQRGGKAFVREGSNLSRCFIDATSGSTGIPLRVYRDPYERAVTAAKWFRMLLANGYSMRYKVMTLPLSRARPMRSIIQRFGILRRLAVDYLLSPEEMVDIFLDYKPDVLCGERSHLDLMALELKRRGIQCKGLKLLIGIGDVIPDSSRRLCRKHFGVELVEAYGSVEMGIMAYETPVCDGLHLCEDLTYFEFLDGEGRPVSPGEPGRVVVTDLVKKLMPFIRYDQGDLVLFERGDGISGNASKRLTQIIGREDDYAVLPDGTRRSSHAFDFVLGSYEDIMQFRVVQRTQSLFQILVVADTSYLLSIRDDIVQRLQAKFPPTVSFEIVQVERIEPDPSGKIKMFVSKVA